MGCDMLIYLMNMGCLVLFGINDFHGTRRKQAGRGGQRSNDNKIFEYTIPREFDYNGKKYKPIEMRGVVL